jgi:hypothetical protein
MFSGGAGGGGGGVIELGAIKEITISGMVLANGGRGGAVTANNTGIGVGGAGGGGAGGGIFIHSGDVTIRAGGLLAANGGAAGAIPFGQTPAGGGGGRILILAPRAGSSTKPASMAFK